MFSLHCISRNFGSRKQFNLTSTIRNLNSTTANKEQTDQNVLFEHIKSKILLTGPVTVAAFMKEILTHPKHGYYINKDVFGTGGDFITSPEITQMFGELVSVWFINEMNKINAPTNKIDIIELGPGRGTMMRDVLRTFDKLKLTSQISDVCFVEVSNELSKMQAKYLCVPESVERNEELLISRSSGLTNRKSYKSEDGNIETSNENAGDTKTNDTTDGLFYQSGTTRHGTNIKWYTSITDVPQKNFSLILAHEFFDALPIHKFVRTENGWREVLIDFSVNTNDLVYVKSKNQTPACLFISPDEARDHVEISPHTGVIARNIGARLEENGGIGLVIDYGHNGEGTDTFRAYCNHKQTDPLKNIGNSDLTADVDFKYILDNVKDNLVTFGPITQREFLTSMHIDARLNALLGVCSNDHEIKQLENSVDMLVNVKHMGARFKFLCLFPGVLKDFYERAPVYAFSEIKSVEK